MNQESILFVATNPINAPRLRTDREYKAIEKHKDNPSGRCMLTIRLQLAAQFSDLVSALLQRPSIVHFSGHGQGHEGLVFEDGEGRMDLVSTERLTSIFKEVSSQVKCVVLNACFSQTQAIAISRHIEYVIGTNSEIDDDAAIRFSSNFYEALSTGKSIEEAYRWVRSTLSTEQPSVNLVPELIHKEKIVTTKGSILEPISGQQVDRRIRLRGQLDYVIPGDHFWIAIGVDGLLWLKEPEIPNRDGDFTAEIYEGGSPPNGMFSIVLLRVSQEGHDVITQWIRNGQRTGDYPGLSSITGSVELATVSVRF